MKNFPEEPEGPLGPWYRRVNDAVTASNACASPKELISLLGEPDAIHKGEEVLHPSAIFQEMGSIFKFSDFDYEVVFTYVDPYRPRKRYRYGIRGEAVTDRWVEVVDASNQNKV